MKKTYFILINTDTENLVFNSNDLHSAYRFVEYYLLNYIGVDENIFYEGVNSLIYSANCPVPYLKREYKISVPSYFRCKDNEILAHAGLNVKAPNGDVRIQLDIDYNEEVR